MVQSTRIINATVIDGSGSPGFAADVTLEGSQIANVEKRSEFLSEEPKPIKATKTIDASGLVLAPGFY